MFALMLPDDEKRETEEHREEELLAENGGPDRRTDGSDHSRDGRDPD